MGKVLVLGVPALGQQHSPKDICGDDLWFVLFSMIANSHMWLLSIRNVANETREWIFKFHLILIKTATRALWPSVQMGLGLDQLEHRLRQSVGLSSLVHPHGGAEW